MTMKSLQVVYLLVLLAATEAKTAVLFGASETVGSEVLRSLIGETSNGFFDEVILIGRKNYPKVDEFVSQNTGASSPKVTTLTLRDLNDLESYDKVETADVCFIALGLGDINGVTLEYWHSVEVDLIGTIARFCDRIHVQSIAILSAVGVDYESAEEYKHEEIHAGNQKPLGWIKSVYHYMRMKGLEEKAVIENAKSVPHIRLFQPSSIITREYRYGLVDRILSPIHQFFDPVIPTVYHSVDVGLLGMAFVADVVEILSSDTSKSIAKLTYADYVRVAGEAFTEKQRQRPSDEL